METKAETQMHVVFCSSCQWLFESLKSNREMSMCALGCCTGFSGFLPGFMQTIKNIYYQIKLMLLLSIYAFYEYTKRKALATTNFGSKIW